MSIGSLSERDYSEDRRVQESIIGENAAIRMFDPHDKQDMLRLKQIMESQSVKTLMRETEFDNDKEYYSWVKKRGKGVNGELLFAVAGSDQKFNRVSPELGEAQGFVYVYPDSNKKRLRELTVQNILTEEQTKAPVFEISFARHELAENGQMASAVRQVCERINEMYKKSVVGISPEKSAPTITAYVDPNNETSVELLRHSGFEKKGQIFYDAGADTPDDVYVLDWQRLNDILHKKGDTYWLNKVRAG